MMVGNRSNRPSVDDVRSMPNIDWDRAQLAALVARIRAGGNDPTDTAEIIFRVPERKHAARPESVRPGSAPARTGRAGKPTFRPAFENEEPR